MAEDDFTPPSPDERVDAPFVPPPLESAVKVASPPPSYVGRGEFASEAAAAPIVTSQPQDPLAVVAKNATDAALDIAKGIPQMVESLPRYAYEGLQFAAGGPQEKAGVIERALGEAVPQGEQLAKDVQSPLGSRESFRGLAQLGLMAAPALSETLFGRAKPEIPPIQSGPSLTESLFGKTDTQVQTPLTESLFGKPEVQPEQSQLLEKVNEGLAAGEQPLSTPPEQVTASAFKLPSGEITNTGAFHGNAPVEGAEPGFLTSTGRFVGREEAFRLAKQNRQLPTEFTTEEEARAKEESRKPELMGEDIFPSSPHNLETTPAAETPTTVSGTTTGGQATTEPVSGKPASAALRDVNTGEIWYGGANHGLLHDKVPNGEGRELEAGFATKDGKWISQDQSEKLTGMASADELFEMSPKDREQWFEDQRYQVQNDSDLSKQERVKQLARIDSNEQKAKSWRPPDTGAPPVAAPVSESGLDLQAPVSKEASGVAPTESGQPEPPSGVTALTPDSPPPEVGPNVKGFEKVYGPGEIKAGDSVTPEEIFRSGQADLASGKDPYAIADRARTGDVSPKEIGLLAAEHDRLLHEAAAAEGTPEYEAKYQQAKDFAQNMLKPAGTKWHQTGMGLQVKAPVDLSSLTGFRAAFEERFGKEMTPDQANSFSQIAKDVARAKAEDAVELGRTAERVRQRFKGVKDISFEDAVKSLHDEIATKLKDCIL